MDEPVYIFCNFQNCSSVAKVAVSYFSHNAVSRYADKGQSVAWDYPATKLETDA